MAADMSQFTAVAYVFLDSYEIVNANQLWYYLKEKGYTSAATALPCSGCCSFNNAYAGVIGLWVNESSTNMINAIVAYPQGTGSVLKTFLNYGMPLAQLSFHKHKM